MFFPLDPECPEYVAYQKSLFEGAPEEAPLDDFLEVFARKHRGLCRRCQEYGCANIEIAS